MERALGTRDSAGEGKRTIRQRSVDVRSIVQEVTDRAGFGGVVNLIISGDQRQPGDRRAGPCHAARGDPHCAVHPVTRPAHELQVEGIVTQDARGIGFAGSTFAYLERWKAEYRPYHFTDCVFLRGIILRPRRDGGPIQITLEAHDLWNAAGE